MTTGGLVFLAIILLSGLPFVFGRLPRKKATAPAERTPRFQDPPPPPPKPEPPAYREVQIYGVRFFAEWTSDQQEKSSHQPWWVYDSHDPTDGYTFKVGSEESARQMIEFLDLALRAKRWEVEGKPNA